MAIKLLAIMDPIEAIQPKKDSTLAILLEAQRRKWELFYTEPKDLFLAQSTVHALNRKVQVQKAPQNWITFVDHSHQKNDLRDFDIILMRKDPPFDTNYLYTTYLLEMAQNAGCFIVNNPQSIRDANEKLFATWFKECCPPLLVSSNKTLLREFLTQHQKIVVKQLHSMAGDSVFVLTENHPNVNVTLEVLTRQGTAPIMAQRYIPEVTQGDKRIIMIDGKPYPYAVSRVPASDDFRGNLAKGATGVGCQLTERDLFLCAQVGNTLREKGLFFVGLDVIGNYITEINVTSPTGICEIDAAFNVNVSSEILDRLEEKLNGIMLKPKK